MNILYIISLLIVLILFYPLQKQVKAQYKEWQSKTDISSRFVSVLSFTSTAFAIVFWLFLIYWTLSSWFISLDPTKPKPFFLIMYVLGLFSFGIFIGLSRIFSDINKIKDDNNNDS